MAIPALFTQDVDLAVPGDDGVVHAADRHGIGHVEHLGFDAVALGAELLDRPLGGPWPLDR